MTPDSRLDERRPDDVGDGVTRAKASLLGVDQTSLVALLSQVGVPAAKTSMRARQIRHWLYHRGASSFDVMTTLPSDLRDQLACHYVVGRPTITEERRSTDGSVVITSNDEAPRWYSQCRI